MNEIVAVVSAAVAIISALVAYAYRSDLKHLTEKHDDLRDEVNTIDHNVKRHRHDHNNLNLIVTLMDERMKRMEERK